LCYGGSEVQRLESCTLALKTTASSRSISTLVGGLGQVALYGCTLEFGNTGQYFGHGGTGHVWVENCTISGSAVTTLVDGSAATSTHFSGCDFSAGATAMNLCAAASYGLTTFRNCKLPASWSGTLGVAPTSRLTVGREMHNCDSGDTNYRVQKQTYAANLVQETTLVRTGGASDGTTPISWKIASTANADWHRTFTTPEIVRWNSTIGSAVTVSCEILHDSATALTDAEVWLEVMHLGTSGVPLGTWASDRAADILATPANQTTSSATWTTTGMTNPNTQKLAVTITPREVGFIHARVVVAKASKTLYVCPRIEIT
jgi:hypothetical protein